MYILDTNIVSELRTSQEGKSKPKEMGSTLAVGESLHLCDFSIGTGNRDKEQGAILRAWMDKHVLPTFLGRILAIDIAVAQRCAAFHLPNPRSDRDALIAATP